MNGRSTSVPVPDPTSLTTEQLRRELGTLRELIEARLDGMDKEASLLSKNVEQTRTDTDKQLSHLRELQDEKFVSIQKQFAERDVRTTASEDSSKLAIKDALQAQKESAAATQQFNTEAISKSEAGFKDRINSLETQISTAKTTLSDGLNDFKERVVRLEAALISAKDTRNEHRLDTGQIIAWAVAGVAAIGLFMTIIGNNHQTTAPATVVSPAVIPVVPK